jgi:hypothetical protein
MNNWTTTEIHQLRAAYEAGAIVKEIFAMFPRHPPKSVKSTLYQLDVARRCKRLRWLRLAHEYFARREAGSLA